MFLEMLHNRDIVCEALSITLVQAGFRYRENHQSCLSNHTATLNSEHTLSVASWASDSLQII